MSLRVACFLKMSKNTIQALVIAAISGLSFSEIAVKPTECPGLYCGRQETKDNLYTECGACPRGSRPNSDSICTECTDSPTFYDWLYLGYMALLSLLLHWFFIDYTNSRKRGDYFRSLIVLHLSALVESILAIMFTLMLSEPIGTLGVTSCRVTQLEDWYTMLYNPTPNYTTTLHCTQEVVYPLYTIVMIYYAFSLLLLMAIRPLISAKFVECRGTKSIYAALYFLPILIVVQAVFGGLLYYAFPYILIVCSLITSAIHMANSQIQDFKNLIRDNFCGARNMTVIVGNWVLHAYAIIAITQLKDPSFHTPLITLVVFPVIFYIVTVKFTNPDNLQRVGS